MGRKLHSNVGPDFSGNNLAHQSLAYAIGQANGSLRYTPRRIDFPNLQNFLFGQLRHLVFFAALVARNAFVTPLRYSIALVDKIIPEKKVIWVAAWRIVTAMKHIRAWRYLSIVDGPHRAVSEKRFSAKACFPVSLLAAPMGRPFPASGFRVNFHMAAEPFLVRQMQLWHRINPVTPRIY